MASAFNIATGHARRVKRVPSARCYSRFAPQLLPFLARHRTVVADQVQREFADVLGGDRNTRLHLQTLVAHGELAVQRDAGLGRPNVYVVTARGLRAAGVGDAKRRRTPSGSHVAHELLITEVAVSVGESVRKRADLTLTWEARFELGRHEAFQHLVPDYAFLFSQPQGRLVCLVEVSSGEDSATRLGEKLDQYAVWAASDQGQTFLTDLYRQYGASQPRPVFRLLFVVQNRRTGNDEGRLAELFNEALRQAPSMRRRLWATTVAALQDAGGVAAPVWVRGDEVAAACPEWECLPSSRQRRYVAAALRDVPRHGLFPSEDGR